MSPSLQLRLASAYLAATATKNILGDGERTLLDARANRAKAPALPRPRHRRRCAVRRLELAGLDCVELTPLSGAHNGTLVYLPGGGYVNPPVPQHWDLVTALAIENDRRIIVPLYPLAPEGEVAAVAEATADLHELISHEDGRPPAWGGDSAGGGLALATVVVLAHRGITGPAHLVLLAPWLDVRLQHPGIEEVLPHDPTLDTPGLVAAGALWAREVGVDDPRASPVEVDPALLPPFTLVVGDRDIFIADARDFTARARQAGVDAHLEITPGGFHVFPAATFLPESRRARRLLAQRLAPQ